MRVGLGFAVLPAESWFARSPPLGSWIALGALVAMITAYMLVRRGRTTSPETARQLRIGEQARRAWLIVALVGPAVVVLSDAPLLAVVWWFVAGPAFSTVVLVSVFALVFVLAHPREALLVPAHQRVGTWLVTGLLLAATVCIPLVFLTLNAGTDWDATTSLACAMCAAYAFAVTADLLVHRAADNDDMAAEPA